MAIRDTVNVLIPPKAPNLPVATMEYSRPFQDQLLNILRLYFNQIDNFGYSLSTGTGGAFLQFPYVAAGDTTTQYATGNNTPTIVKWNTLYAGNGFTLNSDSTATATYTGVYKITYSLQFANDDNSQKDAIVWLRINGAEIGRAHV